MVVVNNSYEQRRCLYLGLPHFNCVTLVSYFFQTWFSHLKNGNNNVTKLLRELSKLKILSKSP